MMIPAALINQTRGQAYLPRYCKCLRGHIEELDVLVVHGNGARVAHKRYASPLWHVDGIAPTTKPLRRKMSEMSHCATWW